MAIALLANAPCNVPVGHIVDWDMYHPPGVETGFHAAWKALHAPGIPDMVWTPRNGGHWIATRAELIAEVLTDAERFSSRVIIVPKVDGEHHRMMPTTIDPPEHRPWRALLNGSLSPRAVRAIERDIRAIAIELIEKVRSRGGSDFIADFAHVFPIRIFLRIVDLPDADAPRLKWLADQATRPDGSISFADTVAAFHDYLGTIVDARMGSDGEDMFSKLVNGEVEGRSLTRHEALQLCSQVLIAGLDTVVNFLGFAMLHLATHPEQRAVLARDPAMIPGAVEELFRRYPIVTIGREVRRGMDFGGVRLRAGEMVIAPTVLHGMDERANSCPMEVDFGRRRAEHASFGRGHHMCPGAPLARTEMRIALEEWLARIPDFSLKPDAEIRFSGGIVGCVEALPLVWEGRP